MFVGLFIGRSRVTLGQMNTRPLWFTLTANSESIDQKSLKRHFFVYFGAPCSNQWLRMAAKNTPSFAVLL